MPFQYAPRSYRLRFLLRLLILLATSNSSRSFCHALASNKNLSRQRIEPSFRKFRTYVPRITQLYLAAEDVEEENEPPNILTTQTNERMSKEDEEEIDAIFNRVDVDGSGCIDFDELTKYLDGQGFSTKAIQQLFSNMDVNQSGKISRKEFRRIFQYYDADMIFDIVDRDGSGYIDRDELQSHLSSPTVGYSRQEIERLFTRMDTDQNGQICREEFHQAMQLSTGTGNSNNNVTEDCPRGYFLNSVKNTFQPLGPLGRLSQKVETMGPFKHVYDKITNLFGVDTKQISKLGVPFMLSYSILSSINGAISLTMAWYISCKQVSSPCERRYSEYIGTDSPVFLCDRLAYLLCYQVNGNRC